MPPFCFVKFRKKAKNGAPMRFSVWEHPFALKMEL